MAKKEQDEKAPEVDPRLEVLLGYAEKLAANSATEGDTQAVRRIGEAILASKKPKA